MFITDTTELNNKVIEYQEMLRKAKEFIKNNSIKIGKYTIIISENDELESILTEVVQI